MDRPSIAVVIPAYNEENSIAGVVNGLSCSVIPIVVDDASSDGTAEVANRHGATVVRLEHNTGYDGALEAGFKAASDAGFEFVITVDADGQHPPEIVDAYINHLESGADLVLGVRPEYARFGEQLFGWYTKRRFGIRDPLCGMKGYRLTFYKQLGHFDNTGSIGTELMLFTASQSTAVSQLPIPIAPREFGAPRFDRLAKANIRIIRAMLIGVMHYGLRPLTKRSSDD